MTCYQVFLPPPILAPIPFSDDDPKLKLKFQKLSTASIDHSQDPSQSLSLRRRLDRKSTTWIEFSQGGLESLERSTILGKRQARDEDDGDQQDQGNVVISDEGVPKDVGETEDEDEPIIQQGVEKEEERVIVKDFEVEKGRRRSKRVTRQSISLLQILPQIYPSAPPTHDSTRESQEESLDSLSTTTTSFPSQSQLLTNPGNTSVSNLPRWSIPLHKLSTLSTLLTSTSRGKQLCSVIVCVLATEPLVQRQRKAPVGTTRRMIDREEAGILSIGKWTITAQPGPGEGALTSIVRLWDDCAVQFGERIRRGDVVLLENVEHKSSTSKEPSHISISPHHSPKITILYRTLPRYESSSRNDYIYQPPNRVGASMNVGEERARGRMLLEDKMLRPDLRLGRSEIGIRRVEGVARWFAGFVGGEGPG
ncbi:hypothetical protein I302_107483 [Kwoniella bestiolae CBS 10118]|uniref:Uncharacterized protein n=1 Tax=Kwoniella bestiolae CBS 10118 TaxID=1296100 RepID=A0A1B9FYE9_9TREE|nr:hypothetical protein I302_06776 [Kwoniella bestiolae CBS 10118]OCF23792.1 hypothetical protein I302_06776 [Kwoniella bestiolae CBS 10118]